MYSRRRFLAATLTAAAGASLLGPRDRALAAAPAMSTRPIPSTGERIPVIGAGTSGSYEAEIGSPKYGQLQETIKVFFEGGGTVFDTSPNYAGADAVLGRLLHDGGWRERCFLATKIAADSLEEAQAQWAKSLRDLHSERVELLQVHNLRAWRIQLPYARALKEQGKTRYVGITHYTDAGL
ncbi:MAG: aldo/keto reductase, partial [Proteobacteria bacterium]